VSEFQARQALAQFGDFGIRGLDTQQFVTRMWELRNDATGYDAAYVAAAERYGCPLVTTDRELAAVAGARCEMRVPAP
jgi:predicted nucleic acid-binding protein